MSPNYAPITRSNAKRILEINNRIMTAICHLSDRGLPTPSWGIADVSKRIADCKAGAGAGPCRKGSEEGRMTHQQQLRVAQVRRTFTRVAASLKLAIDTIDQNKPFDLAIFEQQVEHVVQAARDLAEAEEQARKGTAA